MKIRITLMIIVMAFALIGMTGHSLTRTSDPAGINPGDSKPPTFETKTGGLAIKVWIMTREEHEQMMKEMKNKENMSMDKDKQGMMNNMNNDAKKPGTHHMKMVVTDAKSGMVKNGLSTKVEITSPSKIMTTVNLNNMSDHYGSDLMLNEKGSYMFMIHLDDKGAMKMAEFKYKVQ